MNIIVSIMLIFAIIGFVDKMFQLNLGLSDSFDKGLMTMGTMSVSIVGICSVGITFIQQHLDIVEKISSVLPFDASFRSVCFWPLIWEDYQSAVRFAVTTAFLY